MKIEDLIPKYEKAMIQKDDDLCSDIYMEMIDSITTTIDVDDNLSDDEISIFFIVTMAKLFRDYYLEKMVKENMVDPLVDEDGKFEYRVLPKGRKYLKKLQNIYGEDIIGG